MRRRAATTGHDSGSARRLALCLLSPLLICAVTASGVCLRPGPALADEDPEEIVEHALQQARLYHRRGRLKEARRAISEALSLEEGQENARVHLLAAEIHRDRGEIDLCLRAISKARQHGDAGQREKADAVFRALKKTFGEVRILTPNGVHLKGRIFLESTEPLINVRRKTLFKGVQRHSLVRARRYPDSIWLPFGAYSANGVSFQHRPGGRTEVDVPFPVIAVLGPRPRRSWQPLHKALAARVGGVVRSFELPDDNPGRSRLVKKLRGLKPRLIVAVGPDAVALARERLARTSLLFTDLPDEQAARRLAASGRGAGVGGPAAPAAVLEPFAQLRPGGGRVALVAPPGEDEAVLAAWRAACDRAGYSVSVWTLTLVEGAWRLAAGTESVVLVWLPLAVAPDQVEGVRALLLQQAHQRRAALVGPGASWVPQGALLGVAPSPRSKGIQLASQARRLIFSDAELPDIGLESPDSGALHLNAAAAGSLGWTIPPALRESAHSVHGERAPAGATP